jgi:isocitrate dehydrogenase kinase/phosphatase
VHGALFTAAWWQGIQARLAAGKVVEFAPYPGRLRLPPLDAR